MRPSRAGAATIVLVLVSLIGASSSTSLAGDREPTRRVINGDPAPPGSWPSIVRVSGCGGTLIKPGWVLTAAHCGVESGAVATIGRRDLDDAGEGEEILVERAFRHPLYGLPRGITEGHDFALLRLAEPSGQPTMPLAAVDRGDDPVAGEKVMAAGWGVRTRDGRRQSRVLQQVALTAWGDADCEAARGTGGNQEADVHLCAVYSVPGEPVRDTCGGDSGGPLTVVRGDVATLVGMTSYGPFPCARRGSPGVYSRVSSAGGWIARMTGRHAATDFTTLELAGAGDGALGAPSVVALLNDGPEPVTLSALDIDPGFEIVGGSCSAGSTIEPRGRCNVEVAMRASGIEQTGELRITTDADDEPMERIGLSGRPFGHPPPDTAVAVRPARIVRAHGGRVRLGFGLAASVPGAGFECAFGPASRGAAFRPCDPSARFIAEPRRRSLTPYRLRVRATSASGTDPTPAGARVLVIRGR